MQRQILWLNNLFHLFHNIVLMFHSSMTYQLQASKHTISSLNSKCGRHVWNSDFGNSDDFFHGLCATRYCSSIFAVFDPVPVMYAFTSSYHIHSVIYKHDSMWWTFDEYFEMNFVEMNAIHLDHLNAYPQWRPITSMINVRWCEYAVLTMASMASMIRCRAESVPIVISVPQKSLSIDPTMPAMWRAPYFLRCSSSIFFSLSNSSNKLPHSWRNKLAPVNEPSPPMTTYNKDSVELLFFRFN